MEHNNNHSGRYQKIPNHPNIVIIFDFMFSGFDMFDFGLSSIVKNISAFGVIYTKLMLKLEYDENNYLR